MADPISELVIKRESGLPPNEVCEEVLSIGAEGELVWEHYDSSPSAKKVHSDYDHENPLWIEKVYKDTLLLHIIADHFKDRDRFLE